MDREEALRVLELEAMEPTRIHKQYRKLALKHHPDKNGDTAQFQRINEAYHVLLDECDTTTYGEDEGNTYEAILRQFVASVITSDRLGVDTVCAFIQRMASQTFSVNALDKETLLNLYIFLSRYKSLLYLSDDMIECVRKMVVDKYHDVVIYRLNPGIDELIHTHFYKLYDQDRLYLVPLWHSESYFDGSGCEIIALCEPVLPPHMTIDDCNQLIVEYILDDVTTERIVANESIGVEVAGETHWIPLSSLYMRTEQYYRIKGKGLVRVKPDNLYNVSDRADILVKIVIRD